ncbi:MAG: hybrid sensor histidine kinase/response regulator [Labilithrix sp.]|nr:hybrid sensor histidine kinase/response regulator [Labilithrix sp.]
MDGKAPLVLYVDDEHTNRVVFEHAFGKKYRVIAVGSGQAALEVLTREPVALLVTDQRMPGMSGDELLMRFKELSPDTVRMVVTAYSDVEPILKAVNEGLVVRYIVKPWNRAELDEILRWALEVFELGRSNSAIQLRLVETERVLTLGQVTAAVVHDLMQPIALITMNTGQLARHAEAAPLIKQLAASKELDADARDRLVRFAADLPDITDELSQTAKLMADVLDQLREFQKTRVTSFQPADVDPVPLVRLAVQMCREGAVLAECTVINDVPKELPSVHATTSQVLQVMINLVRNAQQAIGRKGGGGKVFLQATALDSAVRFVVRDEGEGMPPEVVVKLGTPFFTTSPDGTGLGVAQVRRIIGTLGGDFAIDSTVGKGTTVTFTIPRTPAT